MVNKIKINAGYCEVYLIKQEKIIDEKLAKQISTFNGKLSFDTNIKISFNFDGNVTNKMENLIKFFQSALKND